MTNGQGSQGSESTPPPPQPLDPYGARSTMSNSVKISIGTMLLMMIMSGIGAAVSTDSCTNHRALLTSPYTSVDCVCYPLASEDAVDKPNPVQPHIGDFEDAMSRKYQLQGQGLSEKHPSTSDIAQRNVSKVVAYGMDGKFPAPRLADIFDIQEIFHKSLTSETNQTALGGWNQGWNRRFLWNNTVYSEYLLLENFSSRLP